MKPYHVVFIFIFFLCTLVLLDDAAEAQNSRQGIMNAISYKTLPSNTTFAVMPMDDSNQNMILKRKFEHLLKSKGFSISKNAPLVISFDTSNELSSYTTRNRRSIIELDAHGGREGGENAQMRFNLFDSNSGGMFNVGKGETSLKTGGRHRLDVSVINRTNGKHHWQAWTTTSHDRSGGRALILAMVPEMVNKIGKKVTSQIFDLY